jgi:uncharacterized cofD-like protein
MTKKLPKIVVLGGGTGSYTILSGLRDYPVDLTAVISMADSGGSNRILRDEFGILPTSDIRQALVALADNHDEKEIFRRLFTYRFHQGIGIAGMTFGNLFMAALTDIYGSQLKAIEVTSRILNIKGKILPVTLDDVQLVARYENGHQEVGEHHIDEPRHDGRLKIVELESIPVARAYPKAIRAILDADLIVIGPGDLFTSLVSNLIVDGVPQALRKTKGKVVYVVNLMARWGQSYRFSAADHVAVIEKYIGTEILDYVLVNNNFKLPPPLVKRYREEHAFPVENDLKDSYFKVIHGNFISEKTSKKSPADKLRRSIIRHDPHKLAREVMELVRY